MKFKKIFIIIISWHIIFSFSNNVFGSTKSISIKEEKIPQFGIATEASKAISQKANQLYHNLGWKNITLSMMYSEVPLYYDNPNENNWYTINKDCKSLGLLGANSFIDGTQYFAREYYSVKNYNTPYEIMFNILTDDKGNIKIAWLHVSSGIFQLNNKRFERKEWILPPNTSKQSIERLISQYYSQNTIKPIDTIAKAGYFADFKVDDVLNKKFSSLFKKTGFQPKNMQFCLLNHDITLDDDTTLDDSSKSLNIYRAKFFSSNEIKEIEKILNQSANIKNNLSWHLGQSYFSEHKYSLLINNKKEYYYIDFFVYPISSYDLINKNSEQFATWLVIKPAKINNKGVLDRLIYKNNTNRKIIESDLKIYYNKSIN